MPSSIPGSGSIDFKSTGLPIVQYLEEIAGTVTAAGLLVLTAEPGAGKTSLVPLALAERQGWAGKILVVEPRRVAAVSAAARMAELSGTPLGEAIGYRVRGESRATKATRIEVVTGGTLIRMLASDPLLDGVRTVIFDEFHERTLDVDLGLALCLEARRAGRDQKGNGLGIVVMSATLNRGAIADYLAAPCIAIPGRAFPVETSYAGKSPDNIEAFVANAVVDASAAMIAGKAWGDVLVFLPGMAEILRVESLVTSDIASRGIELLRLHGSLPLAEQRRAIVPAPDSPRRIILSTSVAETSLTVPRISLVIDSGLARSSRFDLRSGLNRLITSRESMERAEQRRGRAGRLGPGRCIRAWAESERLPEQSSPEILTAELSGLILECLVWGAADRRDIRWLDPPNEAAWKSGLELLHGLGATDRQGTVTALGREMASLGTEPRLAALVLEGKRRDLQIPGAGWASCLVAALVSEGDHGSSNAIFQRVSELSSGDRGSPGAPRILDEASRLAARAEIGIPRGRIKARGIEEGPIASIVAAAWPDRIARREASNGTSATFTIPAGRHLKGTVPLAASSWIVALDADAGETLGRVHSGLGIDEAEALHALSRMTSETIELSWKGRSYRARRLKTAGALLLSSTAAGVLDRQVVAAAFVERIMTEGFQCLLPDEAAEAWLARVRWWISAYPGAGFRGMDTLTLAREAKEWLEPFIEADVAEVLPGDSLIRALEARLSPATLRSFHREAPERLELPSGRSLLLIYGEGPAPVVEARISDFYGMTRHPCLADKPIVLRLLSPAGRPVQVTADLPGFWKGVWSEVRKELRGRYPKHDWPEHPELATPGRRGGRP